MGSTSAVIENMWSIAHPHMSLNFEKRTKGLLVLDSWVEKNLLEENLRFEKICQKGFEFNGKGLVFPTGHIKLTDNSLGKKKVYEALLLKTCVGKSYCLPAKSDYKENYKLPYGFDSIYFYNEDEE